MAKYIDTEKQPEKAILLGVITHQQDELKTQDYLKELAFLFDTAGGVVIKHFTQKLEYPNPRTYIGTGKLSEVRDFVESQRIDVAVFDDELSASQIRNLEKTLKCKILDRTNLILDIFAKRARTSYAKTQVELAQYEYLLPRLTRMWTHLERQRGGIGLRGPGETELETDRRIIRDKISLLKSKLKAIDRQKTTQRKKRVELVHVALIGYTNVGKSTIMNLLSKSDIFAEDKLFATLDTTVRKVVIKNLPFLLSDTVGFIRKLPHGLIESFKSTLDEIRNADVLLHIVDISHPNFEEQIKVVKQTLAEIKAVDKPTIIVFNKTDAYTYTQKEADDLTPVTPENYSLDDLKNTWMAKSNMPCLFISALKKENINELKEFVYDTASEIHSRIYPYNNFLY